MTTKEYTITGMTCMGCVAKVKSTLENLSGINQADIKLEAPQGKIEFTSAVEISTMQQALADKGNYTISEVIPDKSPLQPPTETEEKKGIWSTYKPLFLIVLFIAGVGALAQYPSTQFSGMLWMRHFMAGFFIVFSFFKLLNIQGFAMSYQMYDIVAAKVKVWAYIYPFVELALGIAYLINFMPDVTNAVTILVLGVSSIGVIKSNLNKQKIKCACLGDVFNLPMSTITIIEDVGMVLMAIVMMIYA